MAKRTATEALVGEVAKPAFDQIEPRTGDGGKAQVKTRMATQPTIDAGMLVGSVTFHDQMHVQVARRLLSDAVQETDEFLMPVLRHAVPDDDAQRAQGCDRVVVPWRL